MINFHVGQAVVCIDDKHTGGNIIVGSVYEIAKIEDDGRIMVNLVGSPETCFWHLRRFRPLIERKADISVFKAMLTPSKVGIPA